MRGWRRGPTLGRIDEPVAFARPSGIVTGRFGDRDRSGLAPWLLPGETLGETGAVAATLRFVPLSDSHSVLPFVPRLAEEVLKRSRSKSD